MEPGSGYASPMTSNLPIPTKPGLLLRVTFVMLCVLVASTSIFAVVIYAVNDQFEQQLLDQQLTFELDEYTERLARNGSTPFPQATNLRFYLRKHADIQPIPDAFLFDEPGIYHSVSEGDRTYHLGIRDLGDDRAYLALDITDIERQETKLRWTLVIGVLSISSLSLLLGFWLSRRIIRPISQLTKEVANLEPGVRGIRLTSRIHGYEAEIIAHAFDRYLSRMDEYVEREQSFSSAASHELRTPLSIILTSSELLLSDPQLRTATKNQLLRVQRAAKKMSELVTAFLFLAREQSTAPTVSSETEVCTVLRQVADDHMHLIDTGKIDLQIDCGKQTFVAAPESHLGIVIGNLLNNAIFHTQTGFIHLTLKQSVITLSDSGPGITPEELENIFSPRYRGQRSQGHGLGLYIAKNICTRYGWTLTIDSSLGQGTVATLDLSAQKTGSS